VQAEDVAVIALGGRVADESCERAAGIRGQLRKKGTSLGFSELTHFSYTSNLVAKEVWSCRYLGKKKTLKKFTHRNLEETAMSNNAERTQPNLGLAQQLSVN
jgi:hypothetical protein